MKRLAIVFAVVAAFPLVARAEPTDDGFGTPLPGPTAYPAMAYVSPYVMSLDLIDVPSMPSHDLGSGVVTPRGAAWYGGTGFRAYGASLNPGAFWFYSMGGNIAFGAGGAAETAEATSAMDSMGVSARMFSIELPSPGIGYRTRTLLVGAQLVPAIDWFLESFSEGVVRASASDHDFALAVDVQACIQYNVFGMFGKNSAACLYAAPAIYREGWFQGASFGIRLFPL